MPVRKKRSMPIGPLAAGGVAVLMLLGLVWFVFFRSKPTAAVSADAAGQTAKPAAKAAAQPAAAPKPAPASPAPAGLAERVARLEAFLPPDAPEPTDGLIARLERLEAKLEQVQAQLAPRVPGTIINEWRVPAQKPDDPPAVSNDFLVTRSVWRVACRVAKEVAQPQQVLVRVYLRQEPERVIAEIPANSSMEIRSQPGAYFFRVTAVGADVVVAWECQ